MFRFSLLLLAVASFLGIGCRQSCSDHRTLGERIRDRRDDRRNPGTERDRAAPPGIIQPRDESIPATPVPVTPRGSNFEFDPTATLPTPKRSSEKIPSDPPKTIASDPLLIVPPPKRTLLLPDPLLQDPLQTEPKSEEPKQQSSGILCDPIIPGEAKPVEETKAPTPPAKTDLPSDVPLVGVDSFAAVPGQENVSSGKKPTFDGFDSLKTKGFKTVLYLHAPDADTSAAKETVESRGLKFVALAVSPQTFGDAAKTFAELVKDATTKPLYVYDLDGTRAGSLWYLQFRTVEMESDEVARIRAGKLGLRDESASEEQKQFWIAIQAQLAKR